MSETAKADTSNTTAAGDADAAIPLWQVLKEEFTLLDGVVTTNDAGQRPSSQTAHEGENAIPDVQLHTQGETALRALYEAMHGNPRPRSALCLSGGGIRSATFNLGLLQALAACGLLKRFDCLSTVSAGGCIGSWFSAWVLRHPDHLRGVIGELTRRPVRSPIEPEPPPIRHLRAYSRYLSPRLGSLSADTWTLISVYVRNLLLNWLVLIPLLMAALMAPRGCVATVNIYPTLYPRYLGPPAPQVSSTNVPLSFNVTLTPTSDSAPASGTGSTATMTPTIILMPTTRSSEGSAADQNVARGISTAPDAYVWLLLGVGVILAAIAFSNIGRRLPSASRKKDGYVAAGALACATRRRAHIPGSQGDFLRKCWLPLVIGSMCCSVGWAWSEFEASEHFRPFMIFGIALGLLGNLLRRITRRSGNVFKSISGSDWTLEIVATAIAGFVAGAALWASALLLRQVTEQFAQWHRDWNALALDGWEAALYVCLAPPLFLVSLSIGGILYVGVTSRLSSQRDEDDREWWSRAGAWLLIGAVVWLVGGTLVLFGPALLVQAGPWAKSALLAAGGGSGLITILLGKSARTAGAAEGAEPQRKTYSPAASVALAIAAPLFICFLVTLLSLLTDGLLRLRFPPGQGTWSRALILPIPGEDANGPLRPIAGHNATNGTTPC
jgi:hypothetical protein